MSMSLFQNHKVALAFAGVTLFGAALFAGSADSVSTLLPSSENTSQESQQSSEEDEPVEAAPKPQPVKNDQPVISDWASDDDLRDNTEGFAPVPDRSTAPDRSTTPDQSTTPDSERSSDTVLVRRTGPLVVSRSPVEEE